MSKFDIKYKELQSHLMFFFIKKLFFKGGYDKKFFNGNFECQILEHGWRSC